MPISLRAEMLLYMASRAQLVEEVIAPALAAGQVVISDRFLLANIVYQGNAGGLAGRGDRAGRDGGDRRPAPRPDHRPGHRPGRSRGPSAPPAIGSRTGRCSITSASAPAIWPPPRVGRQATVPRRPAGCPVYPAPIVLDRCLGRSRIAVFERIKSEVERVLALDPRP